MRQRKRRFVNEPHLPIYQSVHPSYPSHPFNHLPFSPPALPLAVHPFMFIAIHLAVHPWIKPFIHLYTHSSICPIMTSRGVYNKKSELPEKILPIVFQAYRILGRVEELTLAYPSHADKSKATDSTREDNHHPIISSPIAVALSV